MIRQPPRRHEYRFSPQPINHAVGLCHGVALSVGHHELRAVYHRLLRVRAFAEWHAVTYAR